MTAQGTISSKKKRCTGQYGSHQTEGKKQTTPPPMRKSKMGRRRAIVLIVIHIAIAAHIVQWLATGSTVSPVEPSEAMQTLEIGRVNAGFLFFCAAILATLIFGRFFCGWGCHLVALQDLCAWIMKKCGVRPKPFRSRLLVAVPLLFGLYMFVWPTAKRIFLQPFLAEYWPAALAFFRQVQPFQGFSNHLIEESFWETFPPWMVAIPFLMICGFATVYFLGAKGFCTYGCPYGGIFGPVDRLTPGKILVDSNRCERCGHCTATCTSNVRVHEEIHIYGMVVDSGCMKCMDCISVCPNDALSFGIGRPSIIAGPPRAEKPKRVYDLTLLGEGLVGAVFIAVFLAVRGAYRAIPMLMAIGVAGCVAFMTWKLVTLLRNEDVSIQKNRLKTSGRITKPGWIFIAGTLPLLALVSHTGWVRYHLFKADRYDDQVRVSREAVFSQAVAPLPNEAVEPARRALSHYQKARSIREGGYGLLSTEDVDLRIAWLSLVAGDLARAESELRGVLAKRPMDSNLSVDLARVFMIQKKTAEAEELLETLNPTTPGSVGAREELARIYFLSGRLQDAIELYRNTVAENPGDATARARLASLFLNTGQPEEALDELRAAVRIAPENPDVRNDLATVLHLLGKSDEALAEMEIAAGLSPDDPAIASHLAELRAAQKPQ